MFTPDKELIDLTTQLVAIDSINPDLIPNARGEVEIADFVAQWGASAGLEALRQTVEPSLPNSPARHNVVLIARAKNADAPKGKSLMLNAHMDTVGVAGMSEPFVAKMNGTRLYGRGAYDMKASLAASMLIAKRALNMNLRGDVIVSAVADEEVASVGTQAIIRDLHRWRPSAVIVTEPTEMTLAIAHKGFVWFDIETFGVAAHGSRPHLGVDAIAKMGKVLTGIERLDQQLRCVTSVDVGQYHPYLGTGSVHASLISGGQELSSYPAYCKLQIERRTLPSESPDLCEAQLQAILNECATADSAFKAKLSRGLVRDAFGIDEKHMFVGLCQKHFVRVMNNTPKMTGLSFWADSAFFASAGLPTLLLGPSGFGAHGEVEWVDLESVQTCMQIYTAIVQEFCA